MGFAQSRGLPGCRRQSTAGSHSGRSAFTAHRGRRHGIPFNLGGCSPVNNQGLRVNDDEVMRLLKLMLTASGKQGVPQGGVISPLLSNVYLTEVDRMLERAKNVTRNGKYTYVEYVRFADDLVVLIDAHPRHAWLLGAVSRRLREEFAKLQVEVNEEKSRTVDLERTESFGFLGLDFRRLRSVKKHVWRAHYTPKLKKRTALLRKLKEVFRRYQSQPVDRVVELINPVLRGWVNYFAVGGIKVPNLEDHYSCNGGHCTAVRVPKNNDVRDVENRDRVLDRCRNSARLTSICRNSVTGVAYDEHAARILLGEKFGNNPAV